MGILPIPDEKNQRFNYVIDDTSHQRQLYREGDLVIKTDNKRFDAVWRDQMEKILTIWPLEAFYSFTQNGYITRFIDGQDLHGNNPFSYECESSKTIVSDTDKLACLTIFSKASEVGKTLGFTFGDITCGNILMKNGVANLIDYDAIVPWPLPADTFKVWANAIKLIFS